MVKVMKNVHFLEHFPQFRFCNYFVNTKMEFLFQQYVLSMGVAKAWRHFLVNIRTKSPNDNLDFPVYIHFFHSSFSAVRMQIRKIGNQTLTKLCSSVYLHLRVTILWITVKFYIYRTRQLKSEMISVLSKTAHLHLILGLAEL